MAAEDLSNRIEEFEKEKRCEGADLMVEVKKVVTEECVDEKDEISDSPYEFVGDAVGSDEADLVGKGVGFRDGDLKVENGHDPEHDVDHASVCVDSVVSGGGGEEKRCVKIDANCGSGKLGGEEGCDHVSVNGNIESDLVMELGNEVEDKEEVVVVDDEVGNCGSGKLANCGSGKLGGEEGCDHVSVNGNIESDLVMELGNEVEDKEEVVVVDDDEHAEEIPELQTYVKEVLELHEKACNGESEIVESNDQVVDSVVVTSDVSVEQPDSDLVEDKTESQLVITEDVVSESVVLNTNVNCQEDEHSDDTSSDPVQQEPEQVVPTEEDSSGCNDCVTLEVVTADGSLGSSETDACNLTCVEVNGIALQDDDDKFKVNPVDSGTEVKNHVLCSQSSTDICVEDDEKIISSSSREMVLESMDDNTNAVAEKDLECEVEHQNIKNGKNVSTIYANNVDLENSIENASSEEEVVTCSVEEIESKFETTQALIEQWERVDDKDEATSADIETLTSSTPDKEQVQQAEDDHVRIESCKDHCAEQPEIVSKEDDSIFVDNETLASSSCDNEEEQKIVDTQVNIETGKDLRLERSEVVVSGNGSNGGDTETVTSSSTDKGEEQQTADTDVVIGGRNDFDAEQSESVCKEDESSSNTKTLSSPKPDDVGEQRKEDTQARLQMSKDLDVDQSEIVRKEDGSTSWGTECDILPSESADAVNHLPEQTTASEPKRIPCYMIRIPRFSNDNLTAQKDNLEIQVDETTKSRDSLKLVVQNQKATRDEYSKQFDTARKQVRTARDLFNAKRQEIDSIQNTFDMMKSATSIDEIDDKINVLEHRIQHETIPLKEEKQLIREIKALKQTRDKISCTLGSQAEVLEAFEQKHQIEEQFEHLKQELNSLRREMQQLELNTKSIKKKYDDECQALRDLYAQRDAANDLRQQTYSGLWSAKKELHEMNAHFYQYKDDRRSAESLVTSGDKVALKHLCTNQVEKFMELWNRNDEFRNQYVKFNMSSTMRRFKTLDGRSLGPDEVPIVIPNKIDEKLKNASLPPSKVDTSVPSVGKLVTRGEPIQTKEIELQVPKTVKQKKQPDASQQSQELVVQDAPVMTGILTASTEPVTEEVEAEERKTKKVGKVSSETKWVEEKKNKPEEDDLTRKANEIARQEEELKKERAAAELKEKIRLEQIAKAKEAMERKKRHAEKAKAKAELKAQREAEQKEKKKAKKESQKEKISGTTDATNASGEGESSVPESSTSIHDTPQEPKVKSTTASKRTSRTLAAAKQNNKSKALPLPLRSRSKRKMQTWMWFALIAAVVLLLLYVGNYVSFGGFKLSNFGF